MNFSNKLGLSLFVFLAFCPQKVCFAPAPKRSPKGVGRGKLDDFGKPDLEQPFKSEINPYPWIDYLQNPEKYNQLSLKEEEFQTRGDIEYDEALEQVFFEIEKLKLFILERQDVIRRRILDKQIEEFSAFQEEKNQILSQNRNQIYEKLKLELNFLNSLLSDSGKAMAEKCCLDMAALSKQEEINDFYKNHKDFCDKNPDKYEEHKQNLIRNQFSLMKPKLMAEMANLELKRDKLRQELGIKPESIST